MSTSELQARTREIQGNRAALPAGRRDATIVKSSSLASIDQDLGLVLDAKVIAGLDALRAIAIVLVLSEHFMVADRLFGKNSGAGPLGVMIFFVLSGFLITRGLLRDYHRTGTISLRDFYRRRAFRIFPTFYCCWLLTTVVDSWAHQMQWKTAAFSFLYLMDYVRALDPVVVQPWMHMWISWSLAVEEKFYLLWPLLLLLLLKSRSLQRNLAFVIVGLWIYRAVSWSVFHVSFTYVYFAFDMRADALLIGCLLASLVDDPGFRRRCGFLLRRQALSLIPPAALCWLMLTRFHSPAGGLMIFTLEPLFAAIMILQFTWWGAQSWAICRTLPVRLAAQLSYALYLYHPLAGKVVKLAGLRHLGWNALLLTLAMSAASYYLLEKPFMRLRDRRPHPAIGHINEPLLAEAKAGR